MNKRGFSLIELFGAVAAAVLLLLFASVVFEYCDIAGKQQYINSYNKLVKTIDEFEDDTSADLMMDDNKYIAFFSKESNEIQLYFSREITDVETKDKLNIGFYTKINKPDNNECKDKACACLCNSFEKKVEPVSGSLAVPVDLRRHELVCKKQICNGFDNIDFYEKYEHDEGGMIIHRGVFEEFGEKTPRIRTVYIQKEKNNKIVVCLKEPCVKNE